MILLIWKGKVQTNVGLNIYMYASENAILIVQKNKYNDKDVTGCLHGANKIQTNSENIHQFDLIE